MVFSWWKRTAWLGVWSLAVVLAGCARTLTPAPQITPALLPPPTATQFALVAGGATPAVLSTPVIIASPTPTATPVTHVVAEGETLLGIALDYGVSLEALQAANPNVQVRFLSIGTVLVIPPPEGNAALSATQLAPPPPQPVELGVPVCYPAVTGALYCFVEARNPGAEPLENVSARVVLAGADGLPMASAVAYAALDVIPPGGAAPLGVTFAPAPAVPVAAAEAELLTADPAAVDAATAQPGAELRPMLLDVPAHTARAAEGGLVVSGQVSNLSDRPARLAWVTLTLYDEAGQILGFRKLSLANGLAAGEVRDFTVYAISLAGPVDHYTLAASGRP